MRITAVILFMVLLTTGAALAERGHRTGPSHMSDGPGRFHRDKGYDGHGGIMHTKIVQKLIRRAEMLPLDAGQKAELAMINEEHLFSTIRMQAELKIAKIKLKGMLHDPAFAKAEAMKLLRETYMMKLDIAERSIEAVDALRSVIGSENYEQLIAEFGKKGMRGTRDRPGGPGRDGRPEGRPRYR